MQMGFDKLSQLFPEPQILDNLLGISSHSLKNARPLLLVMIDNNVLYYELENC